jgi:hypothetical protein
VLGSLPEVTAGTLQVLVRFRMGGPLYIGALSRLQVELICTSCEYAEVETQVLRAHCAIAPTPCAPPPQVGSEPELAQDSPGYRVLCGLTDKPRQIGGFGAASAMKLALNQLIVSETVGGASWLIPSLGHI